MSMSGYYNVGEGSDAESIRAIHRALEVLKNAGFEVSSSWTR